MNNFNLKYDNIIEVQPSILDDIYTITIEFIDGQVLSIGYIDSRSWLKDYKSIMKELK